MFKLQNQMIFMLLQVQCAQFNSFYFWKAVSSHWPFKC